VSGPSLVDFGATGRRVHEGHATGMPGGLESLPDSRSLVGDLNQMGGAEARASLSRT